MTAEGQSWREVGGWMGGMRFLNKAGVQLRFCEDMDCAASGLAAILSHRFTSATPPIYEISHPSPYCLVIPFNARRMVGDGSAADHHASRTPH